MSPFSRFFLGSSFVLAAAHFEETPWCLLWVGPASCNSDHVYVEAGPFPEEIPDGRNDPKLAGRRPQLQKKRLAGQEI